MLYDFKKCLGKNVKYGREVENIVNNDPKSLWDKIDKHLTIHPKLIILATLIYTLRESKELLDKFEIFSMYETLRKKCNLDLSVKSFEEWLYMLVTCGFMEKIKKGRKIYFKLAFPPKLLKEAMMMDPLMKSLMLSELTDQNLYK